MNGEKRKALLDELAKVANEGRFFVSMETDVKFFRGMVPAATPRVCLGVRLNGESTRTTTSAPAMITDPGLPDYGSVIYLKLTTKEKDEICTMLTNIAQKIGVGFKLLKDRTKYSDGLQYYRFS